MQPDDASNFRLSFHCRLLRILPPGHCLPVQVSRSSYLTSLLVTSLQNKEPGFSSWASTPTLPNISSSQTNKIPDSIGYLLPPIYSVDNLIDLCLGACLSNIPRFGNIRLILNMAEATVTAASPLEGHENDHTFSIAGSGSRFIASSRGVSSFPVQLKFLLGLWTWSLSVTINFSC